MTEHTTWVEFEEKFKPARFGQVTVCRDYMWTRDKDGTDHIVLKDLGWLLDIEPPDRSNWRVDDATKLVDNLRDALTYCRAREDAVILATLEAASVQR
jgi:hypothetical protein